VFIVGAYNKSFPAQYDAYFVRSSKIVCMRAVSPGSQLKKLKKNVT